MNWTLFLNPVKVCKSERLLFFTLLFFALGSYLASYFGFVYDGILDVHKTETNDLLKAFVQNGIIVVFLTTILFGLGYIINRKTRILDILNVVLVFRIPFYLTVLLSSLPFFAQPLEHIEKNKNNLLNLHFETPQIILLLTFGFSTFLLLVYAIILLVNGFKTATNAKKWHHFLLFAIVLLVAEAISKLIA